jgi:hypothetical protein
MGVRTIIVAGRRSFSRESVMTIILEDIPLSPITALRIDEFTDGILKKLPERDPELAERMLPERETVQLIEYLGEER